MSMFCIVFVKAIAHSGIPCGGLAFDDLLNKMRRDRNPDNKQALNFYES